MSKYKLVVLFTLLASIAVAVVSLPTPQPKPIGDYETEWKKVDSLARKGLSKSALELVDKIYEKALKEKNSAQAVKALIHQIKFSSYIEEDALLKNIVRLEGEAKVADFPIKPVMHSMIAQMYWQYYQNNRWLFYNRSETVNFDNEDIATWSLAQIVKRIDEHYQASLENKLQLMETKLGVFDEVLLNGKSTRKLRPTLFDFLSHRAIDFYMNSEPDLPQAAYKYEIEGEEYFKPSRNFIALEINTKDSTALKYKAMLALQDVIEFHLNGPPKGLPTPRKTSAPLIDAELKRLSLVARYSIEPDKSDLYYQALLDLEQAFSRDSASAEVSYHIAVWLNNKGNSYYNTKDEEVKGKIKEAYDKCKATIAKYPGTYGAKLCESLIVNIERKSFNFTLENANMVDKPFRAMLNYKNPAGGQKESENFSIRVGRLDYEDYKKSRRKYYGQELYDYLIKISSETDSYTITVPDSKDFQSHSLEFKVPAQEPGLYIISASVNDDQALAFALTSVSSISYINRNNDGDQEFLVTHRENGQALDNVNAEVWEEVYNYRDREYRLKKSGNYSTDKNGRFTVKGNSNSRNFLVKFTKGDDVLYTDNSFYAYKYGNSKFTHTERTHFFLDRAIYRPGQTIHFKGIILDTYGEEVNIKANAKTKVALYNVNYEKVHELELTANEYGTFSGTFTAPTGVLNGAMHIGNGSGTQYFSVEEYKRPKFEVSFNPMKGSYKLGQEVEVVGLAKAYAGNNIDDAEVKYRVVRKAYFPYPWYFRGWWPQTDQMEITNGTAKTDENGEFKINFEAIPDKSLSAKYKPSFTYTIYADVTDINGETRSGETSINIGYTALNVDVNLPDEINKDTEQQYTISTTNPAGEFEPAKGNIKVYALKDPGVVFRARKWGEATDFIISKENYRKDFPNDPYKDEHEYQNWEKGEKVFDASFDTDKEKALDLKKLKGLAQGKYVIEITSKDKYGTEVKNVKYFTLFAPKETKPPFSTSYWFTQLENNKNYEPGDEYSFLIGSAYDNVKVLYEIEEHTENNTRNTITSSKWLELNNEQRLVTIPIEEKHRGNFIIHIAMTRNNEVFHTSRVISVPRTDKKLDIEFMTFRNKLQPGEKEQWKLKVKGKNGDKVAAEMVATLYDASLDAFKPHSWNFNIYNNYYAQLSWQHDNMFGSVGSQNLNSAWYGKSFYVKPKTYESLNWFGYYFSGGYYSRGSRGRNAEYAVYDAYAADEITEAAAVVEEVELEKNERKEQQKTPAAAQPKSEASGWEYGDMADGDLKEDENFNISGEGLFQNGQDKEKPDLSAVQARTNFNETAFFFPHLETDEEGNVIIDFTIPEALTKWKMLGFSHTKDLKFGMTENTLVTQKELMVTPNAPRFLRENDKITFSAKVSNISDKNLDGTAQLFLFDATSYQAIDYQLGNKEAQKSFTVEAGKSASVSWDLQIPEGVSAVTYRVVAKAGNFSDGEEMALPVLTNRMLVTETLPLPIRGSGEKTFKFTKLAENNSTTLSHHGITVEFTPNPAWYAVQALPYMMEYPYECAEQTFSRYYANSLATHIANSDPKIQSVFEAWKRDAETNKESTLFSSLERNQELKSLLLEETPWVMEAKNESERKRRLALLFDLKKMNKELDKALRKLEKAQVSNGGWPWFKGMPDNRYITQHIATGMGHLIKLGVADVKKDKSQWRMLEKAVGYLDARIKEDYDRLRRIENVDLSKDHLGQIQIQYLYMRSFFKDDFDMPKASKDAFDYYKGQSEKYWLNKGRYMQGMIALALHRYENKDVPMDIIKSLKENSLNHEELGMYWKDMMGGYYWYQAPIETQALLIEAFHEVAKDEESMDNMKVWLLKQKQTQDWKTTKATAEACYALLLEGTDWLADEPSVEIWLGDYKIYNQNPTRGIKENELYVESEAGTGYFKTALAGDEVKNEMGNIKVQKDNEGVSWGAVYWQYFEQLDKITPAETPLSLKKELFVERITDKGPVIEPIASGAKLKVGDKLKVRIELRVDRPMEYVQMKDMRASGFEPTNVLSKYKYQDGLGYYESTRDAATNFFFDYLPRGTYVFEYPLRVSHKGDFSNGITSIQCMYAPEFASHSEGIRVIVE